MNNIENLEEQIRVTELGMKSVEANIIIKKCLDGMLFEESLAKRMELYTEALLKLCDISGFQTEMTQTVNKIISEN